MKPTDEQIESIIALQLDEFPARERSAQKENVGVLLRGAISKYAALADEPEPAVPETPDRTGQWYKWPSNKDVIEVTGPPINGAHPVAVRQGEATSWFSEEYFAVDREHHWLRIPPKLRGMKAKVCRVPDVPTDRWYTLGGDLTAGWAPNDPGVGQRRWIYDEPAAVKTPWPVGPFEVRQQGSGPRYCVIAQGDSELNCHDCSETNADAIAFGLNWAPRAAKLLRAVGDGSTEFRIEAQDLVAEIGTFDLPKPADKTNDD